MATILITGGTGMIGKALTLELVKAKHDVIILTRDKKRAKALPGVTYAEWDVNQQVIDEDAIRNADYIVHLAGAGVADQRWTDKRKKEIEISRVLSGGLLVKALKEIPNKVKAVIASSAIGWYGPDPVVPNPSPFKETDPHHDDFLGATCYKWEQSVSPLKEQKRLVILRTGIVLSKEGGAYHEFIKPLKFKVAAILGDGKQVVSWIHIKDVVAIYNKALFDDQFAGIFNVVAPQPVDNKTLITAIAKSTNQFYIPAPVPAFILKLMLGEMSVEVLKSATVSSGKLISEGFAFQFPDIVSAANDLAV